MLSCRVIECESGFGPLYMSFNGNEVSEWLKYIEDSACPLLLSCFFCVLVIWVKIKKLLHLVSASHSDNAYISASGFCFF